MSKVDEILDGIKNYVFPTEESEIKANKRAEVCGECEHNIDNKCSLCGCFLTLKVRSTKTDCPDNRWEK